MKKKQKVRPLKAENKDKDGDEQDEEEHEEDTRHGRRRT